MKKINSEKIKCMHDEILSEIITFGLFLWNATL